MIVENRIYVNNKNYYSKKNSQSKKHFYSNIYYDKIKQSESLSIIDKYINLSLLSRKTLNLVVSMNHSCATVHPSQRWISDKVGCVRETSNIKLSELHGEGFIDKKDRGWGVIDNTSKFFRKKTCEYSLGESLKSDMDFLCKHLKNNQSIIFKLLRSLPALKPLLQTILTVLYFFFNSSSIKNKNNYIRREYVTILGQDNYNISQIYKTSNELPKITTSIPSDYILPFEDPENIYVESYPYTKQNVRSIKMLYKKQTGGKEIDPRFCTQSQYKELSFEDKQIASHYFTGKRAYGSVYRYEESLIKRNLSGKVWKATNSDEKLTAEQIEIIKSFPNKVLQEIKSKLGETPCYKNNFQWICEHCITVCKANNMSDQELLKTRKLLKDNGFNYDHLLSKNAFNYNPRSRSYKVKSHKYVQPESSHRLLSSINQEKPTQELTDKFRELVGNDVFEAFEEFDGT